MKGIEIEAYTRGYYDGASWNVKYPQQLMIAGYKFEQVLQLVLKDQEEKAMSMTFNEAVELITENGRHDRNDAAVLVTRLEKLGLIKLIHEEKVISVSKSWMKKRFNEEMVNLEYNPESHVVLNGLLAIDRMFEK